MVFFRNQESLTAGLQKTLCEKLSNHSASQSYDSNDNVQIARQQFLTKGWTSDLSFESTPPDYAILKVPDLPITSHGMPLCFHEKEYTQHLTETIWASGYELYDHFSQAYQNFLESLTASFAPASAETTVPSSLVSHSLIRSNPVTGRKSIFALGSNVKFINGLSERESSSLLSEFQRVVDENPDMQVSFKWASHDVGALLRHLGSGERSVLILK